uniref:alpha-amylase family glycosyl hydrolase n=1 Tax=Actinotalea sp. TaxID=1872145 RepID=UPI00356AEC23
MTRPVQDPPPVDAPAWWREAVVYQVYPRSFQDADGDGNGDLRGIASRLGYLAELGVDALWLCPFYPSGGVDGGYDIVDHTGVDTDFGTVEDVTAVIAAAHAHGLRVLVDLVPNHVSDRHPWFRAAIEGGPGAPERELFHLRPGRGQGGDEPPSNWRSVFGGPSWTRITEPDGTPGPWYYHLFAPEQPDLNWQHPAVLAELERVVRTWLDRGVDGFRIDVSDALIKDPAFPDTPDGSPVIPKGEDSGVHEVYRALRRVMDEYPGDRAAVVETGAPDD